MPTCKVTRTKCIGGNAMIHSRNSSHLRCEPSKIFSKVDDNAAECNNPTALSILGWARCNLYSQVLLIIKYAVRLHGLINRRMTSQIRAWVTLPLPSMFRRMRNVSCYGFLLDPDTLHFFIIGSRHLFW